MVFDWNRFRFRDDVVGLQRARPGSEQFPLASNYK